MWWNRNKKKSYKYKIDGSYLWVWSKSIIYNCWTWNKVDVPYGMTPEKMLNLIKNGERNFDGSITITMPEKK